MWEGMTGPGGGSGGGGQLIFHTGPLILFIMIAESNLIFFKLINVTFYGHECTETIVLITVSLSYDFCLLHLEVPHPRS